jgi:RNA polymerase sigma-70 factor (ECF subfamily)
VNLQGGRLRPTSDATTVRVRDGEMTITAVRADLLHRLDQRDEVAAAYRDAWALVGTEPERRFLESRLAEVANRR